MNPSDLAALSQPAAPQAIAHAAQAAALPVPAPQALRLRALTLS